MNVLILIKKMLVVVSFSLFSLLAHASNWIVDSNHSQLSFVSIKKNSIAEVNTFKQLQGSYNNQGQFVLNVDLTSVDTNNPIRDDRMKDFLFDVSQFSTATITADVDTALVDAIAEGANELLTLNANLDLHGVIIPLKIDVIVTRLVGAKLSVVSAQPVIINADDFGLVPGINKLMELAKLPSISQAIPVSFYVTLKLK